MKALLKYEFRRSRTTFFGILVVTLLVEALYLVGWFAKIASVYTAAVLLGTLCIILGTTIVWLYGAILFNEDISKKSGYLLFSTPRSSAKILASKLLLMLFAAFGVMLLFALIVGFDLYLAIQRNGTTLLGFLNMMGLNLTGEELKEIFLTGHNILGMSMYLLDALFSFLADIIIAYVLLVATKTVMGNRKGRGFLAVFLWIVVSFGLNSLANKLADLTSSETISTSLDLVTTFSIRVEGFFAPSMYLPSLAIHIICCVIGYLLTTWLMEKKLSL